MFIRRLESLRGIAALMVALGHSFIILAVDGQPMIWATGMSELSGSDSIITRSLLVFFNGGAAVTIFFVLSGYVLGLSLDNKEVNLRSGFLFCIKRILRIYPAHIVSLTAIVLSVYFFHEYVHFPNTSAWYNWWFVAPLDAQNVQDNYLLFNTNLNNVTWTLQVELIISFIFPIAYLISRGSGPITNVIILALLMYAAYVMRWNTTVLNGFVFFLGLILPTIIRVFEIQLVNRLAPALFFIALAVLLLTRLNFHYTETFTITFLEGISATLMVAIIAKNNEKTGGAYRILDWPIVQKLGQVSYSFYVWHFFALYWVAYITLSFIDADTTKNYPVFVSFFFAIVSIVICFQLSRLSYRFVEMPMVRYGRKWTQSAYEWSKRYSGSAEAKSQKSLLSVSALERPHQNLNYLLALFPIFIAAWYVGIAGRSAIFAKEQFQTHAFGFSDFINFHVILLAVPAVIFVVNYLHVTKGARSEDFVRQVKSLLMMLTFWCLILVLYKYGARGLGIFVPKSLDSFSKMIFSGVGSVYYLFSTLIVTLIVTQIFSRLSVKANLLGLALSVGVVLALPLFGAKGEYLSWMSYWSPLNFLPISFLAILMASNLEWVLEQRWKLVGVGLVFAFGLGWYEWNSLVSSRFFAGQGAAIPLFTRVSLLATLVALVPFVLGARGSVNPLTKTMAYYAMGLFCIHPLLIGPIRQLVKDFPLGGQYATYCLVVLLGYALAMLLSKYLRTQTILGR